MACTRCWSGCLSHRLEPDRVLRDMPSDPERIEAIRKRLIALQEEHRDLDVVVGRLAGAVEVDQLHLRRLKKRKLLLKDEIQRLRSMLIPDLDA